MSTQLFRQSVQGAFYIFACKMYSAIYGILISITWHRVNFVCKIYQVLGADPTENLSGHPPHFSAVWTFVFSERLQLLNHPYLDNSLSKMRNIMLDSAYDRSLDKDMVISVSCHWPLIWSPYTSFEDGTPTHLFYLPLLVTSS